MMGKKDYEMHDSKLQQIMEENQIRRKEMENRNQSTKIGRYLPHITSDKSINQ